MTRRQQQPLARLDFRAAEIGRAMLCSEVRILLYIATDSAQCQLRPSRRSSPVCICL